MSINVTVSGNPVVIKRGKMVTSSFDPSQKEFQKRRLIRLEQVRHQSKNIAESVRSKVQKEKTKQLSDLEKEGEVRLKNWQARKLLDLKDQYQEALNDIGIGHKQADAVSRDEEETLATQLETSQVAAKERGRAAAERLQIQKNEQHHRKAVPIQRKKLSRDIENSRSHVIASLKKTPPSKKKNKKKKQSQRESGDSDIENRVPSLDLDDISEASFRFSVMEPQEPPISSSLVRNPSKEQQTSVKPVSMRDKEAQTSTQEKSCSCTGLFTSTAADTRISERIKRRLLHSQPDYCDEVQREVDLGVQTKCSSCHICQHKPYLILREQEVQTEDTQHQRDSVDLQEFEHRHDICQQYWQTEKRKRDSSDFSMQAPHPTLRNEDSENQKPSRRSRKVSSKSPTKGASRSPLRKASSSPEPDTTKIPKKPKITLKSTTKKTAKNLEMHDYGKVKYYDHPNRFSKEYPRKSVPVERISDEDLLVSSNPSENDLQEQMRQKDLEAEIRGRKAMEKEKICQEYRKLMRQLPVLQKHERIAEIGTDKPKYHMPENRLQELEKKKQNRLDNAYEDLLRRGHKEPKITLKSKYPSKKDIPSKQVPKAASWDTDFIPTKQTAGAAEDSDATDRGKREELTNLLSTLKKQKQALMKEIEDSLPPETVTQIISYNKSSSDDLKSRSTHYSEGKIGKNKRKRTGRVDSPVCSDDSTEMPKKKSSGMKHQSSQTKAVKTPGKKPCKKTEKPAKVEEKIKAGPILQNTSTQTTPKVEAPVVPTVPPQLADDVCEIVIKIKDDEDPEVVVKPSDLQTNVKVINEQKKSSHPEQKIEEKLPEKPAENTKLKPVDPAKKVPSKSTNLEKKPSSKTKNSSWREQLSHSSMSNGSTQYMEPPKMPQKSRQPPAPSRKPRPEESSAGEGPMDPRLLKYIKKLLEKSHASMDNLTVSSASSVSTPSQSVVETPTNNPLAQLRNVMRYFKLDPVEVCKHLKCSSLNLGGSHYNTLVSTSGTSTGTTSSTAETEKIVDFKSCIDLDKVKAAEEPQEEPVNITSTTQYHEIAKSCSRKISNLNALIQKVREEKKQILKITPVVSSENSDLDNTSTSYMNLPGKSQETCNISKEKKSASSSSTSSESDDNLLNVDFGYAERLKSFTPEQIAQEKQRLGVSEVTSDELMDKLRDILTAGLDICDAPPEKCPEKPVFTPMLDIPKLPKFQPAVLGKQKPKPPPSKGLRNLNMNMNTPVQIVPHELSTIAEADSVLSTKLDSPPECPCSPKSPPKKVPDVPEENKNSSSSTTNSSGDKSDLEVMEGMLKSIGMEWAIPTLKKTREALALTSSSSSSDVCSKKDSSLTLREFLSKISTSSGSNKSADSVQQLCTSTPVQTLGGSEVKSCFLTDSDISSVREQSCSSRERFYDLIDDNKVETSSSRRTEKTGNNKFCEPLAEEESHSDERK